MAKNNQIETLELKKIVGGGQALGELESGKKVFVWGGMPGEVVEILITKNKSSLAEGIVTQIISANPERVEPKDPDSYLSTSPWQIMSYKYELKLKAELIDDAFILHHVKLPKKTAVHGNKKIYEYRNKMEYSFWWDNDNSKLDLAFFKRSSHTKIPILKSSLAMESITAASSKVLNILRNKNIQARDLKSMIIRSTQDNKVAVQLYVKNMDFEEFSSKDIDQLGLNQFEIIYSDPKSPASVVTKKIQTYGEALTDKILGKKFSYSTEGFFQVNIPVYENVLNEMKQWMINDVETLDLYSGVGTIGICLGGENTKLVEINKSAFEEMTNNINNLGLSGVEAILSPSENVLDFIKADSCVIVDPPRAGLDSKIIDKMLDAMPKRILYLSCNPVTQARDIERLLRKYKIVFNKGYNFFPRTPHIEHLVVLDAALA